MSASGFYITNPYNDFVGNAASGGWAGFAMPSLPSPVKLFASKRERRRDKKEEVREDSVRNKTNNLQASPICAPPIDPSAHPSAATAHTRVGTGGQPRDPST